MLIFIFRSVQKRLLYSDLGSRKKHVVSKIYNIWKPIEKFLYSICLNICIKLDENIQDKSYISVQQVHLPTLHIYELHNASKKHPKRTSF